VDGRQHTARFARRLVASGASLVAVHGRQRGREDARRDGSADLQAVAGVVAALGNYADDDDDDGSEERGRCAVPVLTNGNVRCVGDVGANLEETAAAGIMVAEQILRDPALFQRARREMAVATTTAEQQGPQAPRVVDLAESYVRIVEELERGTLAAVSKECAGGGSVGRRLRMEDGSTHASNGNMKRYDVQSENRRKRFQKEEGKKKMRDHEKKKKGAAATTNDQFTDENEGGDEKEEEEEEEKEEEEFERMSVWWTNLDVAKAHLRQMLADRGNLASRNNFKRAPSVAAIIACFRKRFSITPPI
jgi:tRNA-dihydrouridine synthase